jgi:hypothetical protein
VEARRMAQKPQPNKAIYFEVLRSMSPTDRLMKAFELTEMTRTLFRAGLKRRFADKSENELHDIYVKELLKCDNSDDWRRLIDGAEPIE